MLLSGAWGKVIHEKNLKQKISWHCPFNQAQDMSVRSYTKQCENSVRTEAYKESDKWSYFGPHVL